MCLPKAIARFVVDARSKCADVANYFKCFVTQQLPQNLQPKRIEILKTLCFIQWMKRMFHTGSDRKKNKSVFSSSTSLYRAKQIFCVVASSVALSAVADTNHVEYILIPVVRVPTVTVNETAVPEIKVKGLSLKQQSQKLNKLIDQWTAVHEKVSGETVHPKSYFGRKREAILSKADTEGITDEVMQMVLDYQTELNSYMKTRIINRKR